MSHLCECQEPGICQKLQRPMNQRQWEFCSGNCPASRPCREEDRIKWLEKWYREIGQIVIVIPDHPNPIEEGPGWFRKLTNFSQALIKHVWNGLPETPTEEQQRRISICLACDMLNPADGSCKHPNCGCGIYKKTRWLDQSCPLGKWGQ